MTNFKKIIIHIGSPKTGTTSLQNNFQALRSKLNTLNIDFFQGSIVNDNHFELALASQNMKKESLFSNIFPNYIFHKRKKLLLKKK